MLSKLSKLKAKLFIKKPTPSEVKVDTQKPKVVSIIIQSEETIPIMVTMSFNNIDQIRFGEVNEYVVNDKTNITIERDGSIESVKSFNLLARLFLDR